jgi:flagellar biosynthesis/type III secretory pathway chaperone
MAPSSPSPPSPAAAAPIATAVEAARLIGHIADVMAALLEIIEEETQLVRAGRISEVARIEPRKSELARLYVADAGLVKANGIYLARTLPQEFDELRQRHARFHALLQINLAVLATAHAVSEGIIRGAAEELARKAAPQTYGVTGRATAPTASAFQPVAVSRRL